METGKMMLTKRDLDLLTMHLRVSNLSDYNKNRLLAEIKSVIVVKENDLPPDIVCMDSEVEIRELESGKDFTFRIVAPTEANMQKNRVSVFAPIAIAILGYQRGSKVQWEMPSGLKTFEILKVNVKEENSLI